MKYNAVLDVLLTDSVSLAEPVSAAEFKVYARIDGSIVNEDTNITNLVVAARKQVEAYLNRSLVARNIVAVLNNSLGSITLPYQDTIADTADIEVKDIDGNILTGATFTGVKFIKLRTPAYEYLKVTYDVTIASIEQPIKQAILQQAAYLYEHRGDDQKVLSPDAQIILNTYKIEN